MDLDWQDGRSEKGRPAVTLLPRHHLDDREFWPDDFVQLAPDSLAGEQPGRQAPCPSQLTTGSLWACCLRLQQFWCENDSQGGKLTALTMDGGKQQLWAQSCSLPMLCGSICHRV